MIDFDAIPDLDAPICSIPGCSKRRVARGYCTNHYARLRRNGDPLIDGHALVPWQTRFWAKVLCLPDGCWDWVGARQPKGYGMFRLHGRTCLAHRIAYELRHGTIPEGLTLDHLCRNRRCVNPAHLEPVTGCENTLRGENHAAQNARKTHCKHGHEFDAVTRRKDGRLARRCNTCRRAADAEAQSGY